MPLQNAPDELLPDGLSSEGFRVETRDLRGESARMLLDLRLPDYDPLVVDFLSGQMNHRLKNGLSKSQPMAKALGLKSFRAGTGPRVIDATAGMGTDAFVMAAMGCHVRGIERSAVIFELLQDGLKRARVNLREITARLSFEHGVSHVILAQLSESERPDVVYLDPMYPEEGRSKSALPKKEMQIFRRLLGDDLDAEELLSEAMLCARERVVVKRPLYAPSLGGKAPTTLAETLSLAPTHSFEGKTARFDMYLTRAQPQFKD